MLITISFGKNPVKGGNPPNDIRSMAVSSKYEFEYLATIENCFWDFMLVMKNIINNGEMIIEYIMKYTIHWMGFLTAIIDIIHPIWPIDEYAIIVRNWDWLIPTIPPIRALIAAKIIISDLSLDWEIKHRIDKGAIFCHVDKIRHSNHEIEDITDGYQKWYGATPSFIIIDITSRIYGDRIESIIFIFTVEYKRSAEPIAWARKYLIEASTSWFLFVIIINGINLIIFNSRETQIKIQFALERAIRVLVSIVDHIIIDAGLKKFIRLWRNLTPS